MSTRNPLSLLSLVFLAPLALPACVAASDSIVDEDDVSDSSSLSESVIDMAKYVIPSCGAAGAARQIGSEQFRVVPMGMQGSRGRFVIVKSTDGSGYEEWSVDKDWLRIRTDTTWAYEIPGGTWCDVKCGDNRADNCQQRWNTNASDPRNGLNPSSPWAYTVYSDPGQASLGAPWIPRSLNLPVGSSTQFTTHMSITGADRSTCTSCYVNFGTQPGQSVGRTVEARRYANWNGFTDVVHLTVLSGPGAGEQYFYAHSLGWIGFNGNVSSGKVSSNAMPSSNCAGFAQGSICAATGGPVVAEPPPQTEPPTQTQPPPSGGCGCRTDVDNFCLYPKNTSGCAMTAAGGYCDPNGDGSFDDADWVRGYNEYHAQCK